MTTVDQGVLVAPWYPGTMMTEKRSVAIVGFAHTSMSEVDKSQADEIWSINYAWRYELPRIDRLFEIHKLEWLAVPQGKRSQEHYEWLHKEHPYPIYTYKQYPEIPCSVAFPFDELFKQILWPQCILEVRDSGEYITEDSEDARSTISYMVMLAIAEHFDRIELYGVEMGSDTEYGHQKPNLFYLLGYAAALGIEIFYPEASSLFAANLYHEYGQALTGEDVNEHIDFYQTKLDQWREAILSLSEEIKTNRDMFPEYVNAQRLAFVYGGALKICEKLLETIDIEGIVGRQDLESAKGQYRAARDAEMAHANHWNGVLSERTRIKMRSKLIDKARENATVHQQTALIRSGQMQAVENMIKAIDTPNPDLTLRNEFAAQMPQKE